MYENITQGAKESLSAYYRRMRTAAANAEIALLDELAASIRAKGTDAYDGHIRRLAALTLTFRGYREARDDAADRIMERRTNPIGYYWRRLFS